jgi:two-component system, response regulator YesN
MMSIVLIEDEPSALRFLTSIIENRCTGFQVVDTAENGAEGLEKIRQLKPDVVITDIKMPVMDGIELVSRTRDEFPFIYSVIASGYQDFEYARGALHSGAVDYLLKPVNAGQLRTLLETIREKLVKDYYAARAGLINKALTESPLEAWMREKYLPFEKFSAAIVRKGGLPSRFASISAEHEPPEGILPAFADLRGADIWILPGRDRRELLFFHSPDLIGRDAFEKAVATAASSLAGGYSTVAFNPDAFALEESGKRLAAVHRALDNAIVPGYSRVRRGPIETRPTLDSQAVLDSAIGRRIDFLVSNSLFTLLDEELRGLFASWEKLRQPQVWIESILRQVFAIIMKKSTGASSGEIADMEFLLDDALYRSMTYGELAENAWSVVRKITRHEEAARERTGMPALFASVLRYLQTNYADPVTLQSVCRLFGISQTYLSKLFRKFNRVSFNEYLTAIRMETAKRFIVDNPEMPLKDVSASVGYSDQFYFSRVFKTLVGVPPSEYGRRASAQGADSSTPRC